MSDRFFFPAIAAFVAGMIALALLPASGRTESCSISGAGTDYNRIEVDADRLKCIIAGGRARISFPNRSDSSHPVVQIETSSDIAYEDPADGPHYRLSADLEAAFSGYRIRIVVRARHGTDRIADRMQVNYSTGRQGETGWQEFRLTPEFTDYIMEWDVPRRSGTIAVDYLGIRPVVDDKRRRIEVERVTFTRLGPVQSDG